MSLFFWKGGPRFLVAQVVSGGAGFKPGLLDSKHRAVPSTLGPAPGWEPMMRTAHSPTQLCPSRLSYAHLRTVSTRLPPAPGAAPHLSAMDPLAGSRGSQEGCKVFICYWWGLLSPAPSSGRWVMGTRAGVQSPVVSDSACLPTHSSWYCAHPLLPQGALGVEVNGGAR